jgi:outer membrane protein assembly factor BamB
MRCRRWIAFFVLAGLGAGVAGPGPPASRWRQALPGWGQPAADDTTAFVLTRRHEIAALDLATGALRWRADTGGPGETPLGSAIRLAGPYAIVGDDAIAAFDRVTGRPVWRFVPAKGHSAGVFLGDVIAGLVLAGSLSGDVYAVDASTGSLRWTSRMTPAEHTAVYPPIVAGNHVVVAFTAFDGALSGGLAAFDLAGRRRWVRRLPAGIGATGGAVSDGANAIVATTDGGIRAFAMVDGRPRWRLPPSPSARTRSSGGRDIRALAVQGRLLVAGSLNGELAAYDLATRRRRWRYVDGPAGAAALRLVTDGGTVYAPYTDGSLVALSLASGREQWRTAATADSVEWPPAARGPHLIAAGSRAVMALGDGAVPPQHRTDSREER